MSETTQHLETSLDVCRHCGVTLAYRTVPWKGGTVAFNGGGKLMDNSPVLWEPYAYPDGTAYCDEQQEFKHEGSANSMIYSDGMSDGMRYRKNNTWPKGTEAHAEYERGYTDGINRRNANKRRKPRAKAKGRGR